MGIFESKEFAYSQLKKPSRTINVQMVEHLSAANIDEFARHHVSDSVPKTVGAGGFHASGALKPLVGTLLRGKPSIEKCVLNVVRWFLWESRARPVAALRVIASRGCDSDT